MKLLNSLIIIILATILQACGDDNSTKKNDFSITTNTKNNTIKRNETLSITLTA